MVYTSITLARRLAVLFKICGFQTKAMHIGHTNIGLVLFHSYQ